MWKINQSRMPSKKCAETRRISRDVAYDEHMTIRSRDWNTWSGNVGRTEVVLTITIAHAKTYARA